MMHSLNGLVVRCDHYRCYMEHCMVYLLYLLFYAASCRLEAIGHPNHALVHYTIVCSVFWIGVWKR